MSKAMVGSLLVLLLAFPTVFGADYTVGDTSGWDLGPDYSTWASGKTFKVGDKLVFTYGSLHGVDEVDESSYKSCGSSGKTINPYSGGSTTVTLSSAGNKYFICPTPGHCSGGMKLQIKVDAASSTTPTTPATPTTPTTPSTTPATPSTPSESGTTPTTANTPSPPPKDSGAATSVSGITLLIGSFFVAILGFMV